MIMKAGAYLKPMLVQCAHAAVTDKKDPYFHMKYVRLARRRGKKKAIIVIARMMVICIYHMINDQKPFSPCDYEELMDHQTHPVRVELNGANVFDYLQTQGYDTSVLVKCNGN